MDLLLKRREMMQNNVSSGPTLIPYVRGGNGSYIDTGIIPDNNTKIIVWARNWNVLSQINTILFGADAGGTTSNAFLIYTQLGTSTGGIGVCWGTNTVVSVKDQWNNLSDYHKYEYGKDGLYIDDVKVASVSTKTFSAGYNLFLFCTNRNGTALGIDGLKDICACKIYKNNVLVRDYVAVNSPDVGLYDFVSDTLFTNNGTGSFTYGTFDPNAYSRLINIYCNNTYFDTLIEGTYGLNMVAKFQPTGTGKYWYSALGSYDSVNNKRWYLLTGNTTYSNARLYFALGSANTTMASSNSAGYVRKVITITKKENVVTAYYNNAAFGGSHTISDVDSSFSTGGTIGIGASINQNKAVVNTAFVGYIYAVSFSNNKNFVAAEVNGIGGMYETYSDTFYPSESGVRFRKGNYVKAHSEYEDGMQIVRHWEGIDLPEINVWPDRINNHGIALTSVTQQDGYYQTSNSSATSATSYGTISSAIPSLGYHWKIVADVAIKYSTSHNSYAVDFGSVQSTNDNTQAFCIGLSSAGRWNFNTKFNGNSSANTYAPSATNLKEPDISDGDWVRRTITLGVRASDTEGMDETYAIVDGLGSGISAPFTPVNFNNWMTGCYVGRSAITPAANYNYASNVRIYSIKVYREIV